MQSLGSVGRSRYNNRPMPVAVSIMCCWFLLATSALASGQPSWRERTLKLLQEGQDEEARRILIEVARRDPRNQDAHALLGQIAFDKKDYREAAIQFAKAPLVLKANPLLLVNYAESVFETNAPEAAKRMLETVARQNAVAQFESGLLLTRFGEYPTAEEHFRLARSAGYSDVAGLTYNLALAQYRLAKFRECSLTLEEVRERFPTADLLNLLALAYIELGEFQKALQTLDTAIHSHPGDERNYVAAARLAIEANAPALGLDLLDCGLGYLPKSYPLLVQRGYLMLVQNRYRDAESDYRSAIELEPNLAAARLGLAFVFTASQRHSEALASLRVERPSPLPSSGASLDWRRQAGRTG